MDLLQQCALAFQQLLPYEYHFTIGRKGKAHSFILDFDPADFHHLSGLHKLKDNARFTTGKRSDIFQEILSGHLTYQYAEKSAYFPEMQKRLAPLSQLESFLDHNEIIFHYNERVNKFSLIQADYLLEHPLDDTLIYLFLTQRVDSEKHVCQTLFPKDKLDFSTGQPRYTLLEKEKIHTDTGKPILHYTRNPLKK